MMPLCSNSIYILIRIPVKLNNVPKDAKHVWRIFVVNVCSKNKHHYILKLIKILV